MILITGAAGFIGSCMAGKMNAEGFTDLTLIDNFQRSERQKNYRSKNHNHLVDRKAALQWIRSHEQHIQAVLHLGARTDTMATEPGPFEELNFSYSKELWKLCTAYQIPFIYASSAATYGDGKQGFEDDTSKLSELKPLNLYAKSKHNFDLWVQEQSESPFFWAGLKFFNVYGPNEYHKGRMASVVFHAFNQIQETGRLKLFKSQHPDYADGMQKRDFIYVMDVVDVIFKLLSERKSSGLYNLGTGQARSFIDLAHAIFAAMDKEPAIDFIDMPEELRNNYQYFTEAPMDKLKATGIAFQPRTIEDGVSDYVRNFLQSEAYF